MKTPTNNFFKTIPPNIGINGDAPKSLGAPVLNLEIRGIPKILEFYDATNELLLFNRLVKIFEIYKVSKNSLIMHNPFNEERLNIFIESKEHSLGGIVWTGISPNLSNLSIDIELKASKLFC